MRLVRSPFCLSLFIPPKCWEAYEITLLSMCPPPFFRFLCCLCLIRGNLAITSSQNLLYRLVFKNVLSQPYLVHPNHMPPPLKLSAFNIDYQIRDFMWCTQLSVSVDTPSPLLAGTVVPRQLLNTAVHEVRLFSYGTEEAGGFTFLVWNKALHILQNAELDIVRAEVSSVYLYKRHKLNKTDKPRLGP